MKRHLAILSLVLAVLPPLAHASDDFPLTTIKNFQRTRGLPENDNDVILDSSLPGLSTSCDTPERRD